jgi:SPP1 family predicted phage head-tail adaptor
MDPGKLRHRITLQSLVPTQDAATGAITSTWVDFATVWASVEPLSAREFIAASATQSKVVARIVIRYLAAVKPSMRAVHGAHSYNIEGVLADRDSGIEYLTLPVSEVVNG